MMDTPSRPTAGRWACLWASGILLLAAGGARSSPPTAPRAVPSASTRATQPGPATAASQAMGALETIEQRLRLTDAQADAYRLAMLRKGQIDDPVALTLFLRKIANLPKLSPDDMNHLDQPAVRNLLANPQRYAGQPIRLRVLVNRVWKWQPGVDFGATPDWTRGDGPIYRYDCLNDEANRSVDEPVYILSPLEPNLALGRLGKDGNEGERIYDIPRVLVAGVFFKVLSGRDTAGRPRDYPVVLVWQMRAAPEGGLQVAPESWRQALGIAIVLFVGIAAYFFWRVRQSAQRFRKPGGPSPGRQEPSRQQEEVPPEEDQADSDLAAAAEEFRKKDRPPE